MMLILASAEASVTTLQLGDCVTRVRDWLNGFSSPSTGSPGEGWGGGEVLEVLSAKCWVLSKPRSTQHSAHSTQHSIAPTLTLPRSTGRGDKAKSPKLFVFV